MSRRLLSAILLLVTLSASSTHAERSQDSSDARSAPFQERVVVRGRAYYRVELTVTVTDRSGQPIRGLTRDEFRIFEDGAEVSIQDFGVEGDRSNCPLSVAVLLDFSESMGRQIQRVREAAEALLNTLRAEDEIMVAKFNQ